MITSEFNIRCNNMSGECGLREKFTLMQHGVTTTMHVILGLDRFCNLVKPAIYTKDNFIPLRNISYKSKPTVRDIDTFLAGKRAVYSMLSNTMLICEIKGSISYGAWVGEPRINFYVPARVVSDTVLLTTKVTANPTPGCLTVPIIEKVRENIKLTMLQSSALSKAEYLYKRLSA